MYISVDEVINQNDLKIIIDLSKCCICKNILYEPVQCSECDNCFCKSCINEWLQKKFECPFRCKNSKFKPNRYINKVLSILNFKCRNGCESIIKYEDIKKHYEEDCEKIDFQKQYKNLLKKYNDLKIIMYDKIFPIAHCHQFLSSYPGPSHRCDMCKKSFELHEHGFRCSTCDIDFCNDCSIKLLNPYTKHNHKLELIKENDQKCDICTLFCHQRIKMNCNICNYGECLLCHTDAQLDK